MVKQNHGARVFADLDQTQQQAGPYEGWPLADLGWCVAGLVNTLAKGTVNLMAPHGLIPLDFAILRLFLTKEEWTTSHLAQVLPVNASRISRQVAKIVDMSLMRRRRLRIDRRVVMLSLTAEGRDLTLDIQRRVHSYEAMLSEGVSREEMAVFASVTCRVMANYAAGRQPGAPLIES